MITVKVFRELGNTPVQGKKVTVHTSTGSLSSTTDRNGSAHFDLSGGKDYKVYVDGKQLYAGSIAGVQVIYVR